MASDSLTPKQELFAQKYVELGNASEAYRCAYDVQKATAKSVNELASTLLKNIKVASRVQMLRDAIEKRHSTTVDDLIAELEQARSEAFNLKTPQLSAAIAATMGKAKMLGFLMDKVEHSGTVNVKNLTDDQLMELASKGLGA